jgi:hypothetical protein
MKHRFWMFACVGFAMATAGHAQEIRKCLDNGVVGYQSAPCGVGQVDSGVVKLPAYADPPQRDGASAPANPYGFDATQDDVDAASVAPAPAPAPTQGAFPFRTSIALGMTDDQVLNTPRWGRPTHIERMGRHRGWREVWTYAGPETTRTLSFVEGRLANIAVDTPVTLASLR